MYLECIKELLIPDFSIESAELNIAEERTYNYFTEFLQECESMTLLATLAI